ncbi:MAG TPA: DUF4038 domain-containing protein [Polyangia bacterium]
MSVTLGMPQTAGNLLVVFAGWNDGSAVVTSVTDTRSDTFALAIGPTRQSTALSQSIYYAKNIAGGPNTVTVQFSPAAVNADIRVLEYAGLDRAAPFDSAIGASGNGGLADTGNLLTHATGDLLVAGDMVLTGTPTAGTGYTARIITSPDGDIAEDKVAGAAGSYNATAPVSAPNGWVIQLAAFKVAGSGGTGGTTGTAGTTGSAGSGGTTGTAGTTGSAGAGGSGGCATFPLGGNDRTLTTSCGTPFLVAGDSPQCFTANLSTANMNAYAAARAAQGFNAIWVNLLCDTYTGGRADASTYDGIRPFTGTLGNGAYDLSKPNPAYFARVDAAVAAAAAHGIAVFLDPIETGGFIDTIRTNGASALRAYGQFLGTRYRSSPNVSWMSGNDFHVNGTDDPLVKAVALGIRDVSTQLQSIELDWPAYSSTLDDSLWQPSFANMNLSYSYNPAYVLMLHDYDRSPHLPNIFIEGNYEEENAEGGTHLTNAHDIRTQAYWSNLSGATGQFYGNHWEVFILDNATWQSRLAGDKGAPQMAFVKSLFEARRWWQLVPDEAHTVVTAGLGNCLPANTTQGTGSPNAQDNTCATTARTPDGALVMTYMPTARTLTVVMSKLAGPTTARWYDPTSGTFTAISGSPFANSGSRTFAPPAGSHADGFSDWVLVLEAQ